MLNVQDFGAKGDNQTDDTAAIQAALAAAAEGESAVRFPAGTYLTHPLRLPSHVTLTGDSSWGYLDRDDKDPQFAGRTTLAALSGDARAFLDLEDRRGTRILGLTLDGRKLGKRMHGIYTRHRGNELNNIIEDCRIEHFSGSGIRFERAWVLGVRRSLIMFNGGHGIDLTSGYDGWIIDCMISGNGGYGLYARGHAPEEMPPEEKKELAFFGSASIKITANRVEWNKRGGIYFNSSNSMQINGCSLDHNFGPGIHLKESVANTVTGNLIRSSGVDCTDEQCCQVFLEGCQGTSVTGNTLWGWYNRTEHDFKTPYPYFGIIAKRLSGCVVCDNAMYHAASREGIRDEGGHVGTVIKDNAYVKPNIAFDEDGGWKLLDESVGT